MIADSQPARIPRAFSKGTLVLAIAALSSCVVKPPPPVAAKVERPLYVWDVEKAAKMKGKPSIVIDLTEQKAIYYRDGQEVGWTTVATGTANHPTPTGHFKVLEKTVNKVSNLYGKMLDAEGKVVVADAKMGETPIPEGGMFEGAKMQYFMRFTYDGVGMHIGPIPRPGRPASHGCIRTPRVMAVRYFEITPMGTPVTITTNASAVPAAKPKSTYGGFQLRNLFKTSKPVAAAPAVPKGKVVQ